jgi:secondary thiamine-phosphate synthase enzyme
MFSAEISIATPAHQALVPITNEVAKALARSGVREGLASLFVQHTTCGLLVNENADPDVARDLLQRLEKIAPWEDPADRHGEGNTAAHLRSALVGTDLSLPVRDGRLMLGTWQGIFLAEFDGPRTRQVMLTVVGK